MSSPGMPDELVNYTGTPLSPEEQRKIPFFQRKMRSTFGAVAFALIAFFSCLPALTLIGPPFMVALWLGIISPRFFQTASDLVCGRWYFVMVLLFERMFGIKIRAFGFNGKFKNRCIFIMNHISHFDWMFFWGVVERQGDLHIWKSITKKMMKYMPVIGQCMQYSCHMFISRHWEQDLHEFRTKIYYYNGIKYPLQLLLFPEGGDLTPQSIGKSDAFADKHGLPRYKYCLHPRTTGLTYVINAMRDGGLDAVYDVTIGYPDLISKTEFDFGKGHIPREVHYHIREYRNEDLPQTDEGIADWVRERWQEKEARLKDFYARKEFCEQTLSADGNTTFQRSPRVLKPKQYFWLAVSTVYFVTVTYLFMCILFQYWLGWVYVMCVVLLYSHYRHNLDYTIIEQSQKNTDSALRSGKHGARFTNTYNAMSSDGE